MRIHAFLAVALLIVPATGSSQEPVRRTEASIQPQVLESLRQRSTSTTPASGSAIAGHAAVSIADNPPVAGLERPATAHRLSVDLSGLRRDLGSGANFRVLRESGQSEQPPEQQSRVELRPGDYLAVRPDQAIATSERIGDMDVTASGTVIVGVAADGSARHLRLAHHSAGLHWDPREQKLSGQLLVGAIDMDGGPTTALAPPLTVQLLAPPNTLQLTELAIPSTGIPFKPVSMSMSSAEPELVVQFLSDFDSEVPPARIPVFRPELDISIDPEDGIAGFGLGKAQVTVAGDARLPPGTELRLSARKGHLRDRTLIAGEQGSASTYLVSVGLGTDEISLRSFIYTAKPVPIAYRLPWGMLIATLLGAFAGATLLVYMLKRGGEQADRRFAFDWVAGVIVGVGITVMAFVGMTLPEWISRPEDMAGEAVPFALAFVAAATATAVMHALTGLKARVAR